MKLTVLGSGTCIPSLTRNAPGYLLRAGCLHLLIDCGSGTAKQLLRAGFSCQQLDAIFLTHFHPDHCADLASIVLAMKVFGDRGDRRLIIGGPKPLGEYYRTCVGQWVGAVAFPVKLLEVLRPVDLDGLRVDCLATDHLDDGASLSYRFSWQDSSVVLTGDAEYSESLADFAKCADLLVADCASLADDKRKGHMAARQCGILARKAGVKAVMLSHLYPAAYPDTARVQECGNEFGGEILLAEDLMEYTLD